MMRCLYWLLFCGVTISALYVSRDKRKQVCMIDLVIVVDKSGSIQKEGPESWQEVQDFLKDIVGSYTIGDDATRIALITFANKVKVQFTFGEENMDDVIDGIAKPNGYTCTASAMARARELLQEEGREKSSKVVLLVTDGLPTKNKEGVRIEDGDKDDETLRLRKEFIQEVIDEGNLIRQSTGAKILALGVTDHVNDAEFLPDLADKDSYFKADKFDELKQHVQQITDDSCKTDISGSCTLDVVFAVDMSGSVEHDSDTLKDFLYRLTSELMAMDPRIHLGLIRFAQHANILKPLDAYGVDAMQHAIQRMNKPNGYTATADALVKAMEMFNGKDGDRPGPGNVLVLISDGLPSKALDGTRIETYSPDSKKKVVYDEVLDKAKDLKDKGVQVFSVVIKGKTDMNLDLLKQISSGAKPVEVDQFSDLIGSIKTIEETICVKIPEARKREMAKTDQEEKEDMILKQLLRALLESHDDKDFDAFI